MIALSTIIVELIGVEPICKVLPIAPSTSRARLARHGHSARLSARARRDVAALKIEVVGDYSRRTSGSMACVRSGGSSSAKALMLRAAPWSA